MVIIVVSLLVHVQPEVKSPTLPSQKVAVAVARPLVPTRQSIGLGFKLNPLYPQQFVQVGPPQVAVCGL